MSTKFEMHIVPVLYPVADAFAGTVNTDIVEVQAEGVLFVLTKGVGAVGTSTLTVDACDNVTPSNTTAIPFKYRISTTPDTWGAWTDVAATGFTTTAGSNQVYQIWAAAEEFGASGYGYARLTAVEVANAAVLGGVNAILIGGRYKEQPVTVLT